MPSPAEYWTMPRRRALMLLGLAFVLGMVLGLATAVVMFGILLG